MYKFDRLTYEAFMCRCSLDAGDAPAGQGYETEADRPTGGRAVQFPRESGEPRGTRGTVPGLRTGPL